MSALTDAVTRLEAAVGPVSAAIAAYKALPPAEDTTASVASINAASASLEALVAPPTPAEVETPAEDAAETSEEPTA